MKAFEPSRCGAPLMGPTFSVQAAQPRVGKARFRIPLVARPWCRSHRHAQVNCTFTSPGAGQNDAHLRQARRLRSIDEAGKSIP